MENIILTVDRDELEHLVNKKFTDAEFIFIKDEMEDYLNFCFDNELVRILDELESVPH